MFSITLPWFTFTWHRRWALLWVSEAGATTIQVGPLLLEI
jgi:hypothetical protein